MFPAEDIVKENAQHQVTRSQLEGEQGSELDRTGLGFGVGKVHSEIQRGR